jgi:acyl-CoA dehydrogenase
MSEMRSLIAETAMRLFAEHATREVAAAAEEGSWPAALWGAIEEAGFSAAATSAEVDLGDALCILRLAGQYAAPVPLAETMLAGWMLSTSGLAVPAGPLSVAPVQHTALPRLDRAGNRWRLSGQARAVPWARDVSALVVLAQADTPMVALVPVDRVTLERRKNVAGEPRDDVRFADVTLDPDQVAPAAIDAEALLLRGALMRAVAMAGALDQVLSLTARYATERVQFGRPIGKMQAVQQMIAALAGSVAAASMAADAAVAAADRSGFEIAAAKARIGEAASQAAALAHQPHGAMGFTREHMLHLSTRRLYAWREEFGDEAFWSAWIGRNVARIGGDGLWAYLTSRGKDTVAL